MKEIDSFRNDVTYFYGSLQRSVLFFFFSGKLFLACFFVVCFVCFHSNFLLLFLFLFLFYFSFSLFLSIFCPLFFFFLKLSGLSSAFSFYNFGFFASVNFNVFFFFLSFVPVFFSILSLFLFNYFI